MDTSKNDDKWQTSEDLGLSTLFLDPENNQMRDDDELLISQDALIKQTEEEKKISTFKNGWFYRRILKHIGNVFKTLLSDEFYIHHPIGKSILFLIGRGFANGATTTLFALGVAGVSFAVPVGGPAIAAAALITYWGATTLTHIMDVRELRKRRALKSEHNNIMRYKAAKQLQATLTKRDPAFVKLLKKQKLLTPDSEISQLEATKQKKIDSAFKTTLLNNMFIVPANAVMQGIKISIAAATNPIHAIGSIGAIIGNVVGMGAYYIEKQKMVEVDKQYQQHIEDAKRDTKIKIPEYKNAAHMKCNALEAQADTYALEKIITNADNEMSDDAKIQKFTQYKNTFLEKFPKPPIHKGVVGNMKQIAKEMKILYDPFSKHNFSGTKLESMNRDVLPKTFNNAFEQKIKTVNSALESNHTKQLKTQKQSTTQLEKLQHLEAQRSYKKGLYQIR